MNSKAKRELKNLIAEEISKTYNVPIRLAKIMIDESSEFLSLIAEYPEYVDHMPIEMWSENIYKATNYYHITQSPTALINFFESITMLDLCIIKGYNSNNTEKWVCKPAMQCAYYHRIEPMTNDPHQITQKSIDKSL